jgi:hypothetical protein
MNKRLIGIGFAVWLLAFGSFASARETTAETTGKTGFFIQAQGGLAFFLKNILDVQKSFNLYGETGAFAESYRFRNATTVDASLGKYFRLGGLTFKVGLGFSTTFHKDSGNFTAEIPHPFLADTPRTITFASDDMQNKSKSFYVYGLFSLFNNDALSLWLGPIIGLGLEKINTLNDFGFDEKAPYSGSDITVTEITYIEDSFTSFWYGAGLDFEYIFGKYFGLVLSGKMIYDNPKILNLGRRANFLQGQASLGFRVIF